ncbi:MAG: hypothetical protein ACJA1Z_000475 [Patiriisocius sp.]|jgi:hypothetical protein
MRYLLSQQKSLSKTRKQKQTQLSKQKSYYIPRESLLPNHWSLSLILVKPAAAIIAPIKCAITYPTMSFKESLPAASVAIEIAGFIF